MATQPTPSSSQSRARAARHAAAADRIVLINRAPVVTLWAAVVAERLGHARETALTLGKAVAVLNARSKGRRLGIHDDPPADERPRRAADRPEDAVELLGRSIPVTRTAQGDRAVLGGQTVAAHGVENYLRRAFDAALPRVEREMRNLAAAYPPDTLAAMAYTLYERLRPEIPPGQRGSGARGEPDLHVIRDLRPAEPRRPRVQRHRGTGGGSSSGESAARPAADAVSTWTKEQPMGQAANNRGRQATLDEQKTRAAGRHQQAVRSQVRDRAEEQFAKGKTPGAFGKAGTANRPTGGSTQGGGGGGGAGSRPRAAAVAAKNKVGRSTRPARKRGT